MKPTSKILLRADFNIIKLAEKSDRWYMGTGATQDEGNINGYLARPSNGNDDLAKTIGLTAKYKISDKLEFEAFYEHIWGGDVIESIYDEDDVLEYTTDPELIFEKWQHLVDGVIDGGFGDNYASTIIDLTAAEPVVIREGKGSLDIL